MFRCPDNNLLISKCVTNITDLSTLDTSLVDMDFHSDWEGFSSLNNTPSTFPSRTVLPYFQLLHLSDLYLHVSYLKPPLLVPSTTDGIY